MIKPRYIKSLTFLLFCNMALCNRKRLSGGTDSFLSWVQFFLVLFMNVRKLFWIGTGVLGRGGNCGTCPVGK